MIDEDYSNEPLVRWITFKLGNENYGVEVKHVREILRISNIFPVPGAPSCVLGITNIRGNVVTVIDGRRRLNLPEQSHDDETRLIVFDADDDMAGIVVDNVTDVLDLPLSIVEVNPNINDLKNSKYIKGVVTQVDGLIIMLDVDNIFNDENSNVSLGV